MAAGVMALAFAAQAFTVHRNFGGDWTALFVTSAERELPGGLEAYRFHGTMGYDGQFYRVLAHDPLLLHTDPAVLDAPALRARRILTPVLAYLLAFGQPRWIDAAYIAVTLGFLGMGVFWSAGFCRRAGLPAWSGALVFVALPATVISLERMTVDLSLAALAAGFAYYCRMPRGAGFWAVLMLAPFARETGALLPLALAAEARSRSPRDWRLFLKVALAGLPGFFWLAGVSLRFGPDSARFIERGPPFQVLLARTLDLSAIPPELSRQAVAGALDHLALLGVWVAVGLGVWALIREQSPMRWVIGLFCVLPAVLSYPGIWAEAYAFARILSPLVLWLAFIGLERRCWTGLLPLALMAPRIFAQLVPHLLGDGAGWK